MKRALLLVALAACSKPRTRAAACETTCEHVAALAAADLEDSLRRIADHSDDATAANLRDRAAAARDDERARCVERCLEPDFDRRCADDATTLAQAQACPGVTAIRARP
jgi:hypothetical protein